MAVTRTIINRYQLEYSEEPVDTKHLLVLFLDLLDHLGLDIVDVTKAGNHCYYEFQKKEN